MNCLKFNKRGLRLLLLILTHHVNHIYFDANLTFKVILVQGQPRKNLNLVQ
jgi:hypothetical protein